MATTLMKTMATPIKIRIDDEGAHLMQITTGTQGWHKRGLIFSPDGRRPWMRTHASNPVALALGGGDYRVFFTSRDENNRAHVGFIDLDFERPDQPKRVSERPALAPGPLGFFDDHGVIATSLVETGGRLLMYYVGWNRGAGPMYYTSIGLAISDDGGETFERASDAPIMARSRWDPWMVSAPMVLLEGGRWRMWYISGFECSEQEGVLQSKYDTKYAESDDGVEWRREGIVALPLEPGERNIARTCVLRVADGYRAWYSLNRGAGYRIGYAESADGLCWSRMDSKAGIEPSPEGWDSEAVGAPWVVESEDRAHLLYNGNDFGREGFGLAQRPA